MMGKKIESRTHTTAETGSSFKRSLPGVGGTKGPRKVLVVEDSRVIQKTYKVFLNKYRGCQVVNADNGREGMSRMAENPDADLILLDLNMPLMNGIQFLEAIKRQREYSSIPVIIISTVDKRSQIMEAMQKGARGYIVKPFNVDTLYSCIKSIFGG